MSAVFGLRCVSPFLLRPGRVPILMYHRVHPDRDVLSVSPERFALHMRVVRECFAPLSLSELTLHLRRGRPLPPRALVVTFDDGYRDNYTHAFPVLKAYGIPATFFVTTGLIGERRHFWWDRVRQGLKPEAAVSAAWPELGDRLRGRSRAEQVALVEEALKRVATVEARDRLELLCAPVVPETRGTMTWAELKEMAEAGMEIGSHTVTHPILANQDPAEAAWEVRHSKEVLERELGREVAHFAYPNGGRDDFSPALMRQIEAAGYVSACSTLEGFVSKRSDPFSLERIGIYSNLNVPAFLLKLAGIRRA